MAQRVSALYLTRCSGLVGTYPVTLLVREPDGNLAEVAVDTLPPHELFHAIGDAGLAHELLVGNETELEEYWERSKTSAWYRAHPGRHLVERHPRKCIPVRIWGDDAAATKDKSLYCLSVSSVVTLHLASLFSRMLIFAVTVGRFVNLEPLWRMLLWSLQCLLDGIMPAVDHLNQPLTGERLAKAGLEVCAGLAFLLTQFTGDLKFLVDTCLFRAHHGTSPEFCWRCRAVKTPSLLSGYDFSETCAWQHACRSHAEWFEESGHMLAVAQLPGFHLSMVLMDLMHSLHLGMLPLTLGSIFVELLKINFWCGPASGLWQHRWAIQLRTAYAQFIVWLAEHNIQLSPPRFTLARLSLSSKSDPPLLKGKAAMNMLVARWLLSVLTSLSAASGDAHHELMCCTLWGFIRGVDIFKSAGRFLNPSEKVRLEAARKAAFVAHARLAHAAIASNSTLWRTIPKSHYIDHLYRCEDCLNPACGWTFADEDWIGRLIRINHRSSDGNRLMRLYLVRLHLLLAHHRASVPQL